MNERAKATFFVSVSYIEALTAKYSSQLEMNCFAFALSPVKSGGALIFTSPVVVMINLGPGKGGGEGGLGGGDGVKYGVWGGDSSSSGLFGSGEGVKGGNDPSNAFQDGPGSIAEVGSDDVPFCFPFWVREVVGSRGISLVWGSGRYCDPTSPSSW